MYLAHCQEYMWDYEMCHAEVIELTVYANKFRDCVCRIDANLAGMDVRVLESDFQERFEE
jgi:hypothetical protein